MWCPARNTSVDKKTQRVLGSKTVEEFEQLLAKWGSNVPTYQHMKTPLVAELITRENRELGANRLYECLRRTIEQLNYDDDTANIPHFSEKLANLSLLMVMRCNQPESSRLHEIAVQEYGRNALHVLNLFNTLIPTNYEYYQRKHWGNQRYDLEARRTAIEFVNVLDGVYESNPPPSIFAEDEAGYSFSFIKPSGQYLSENKSCGSGPIDDNSFDKVDKRKYISKDPTEVWLNTPSGIMLKYRGLPAAIVGFGMNGTELTIHQIQGVRYTRTDNPNRHVSFGLNETKKTKGMNWEDYCTNTVEEIARLVRDQGVNITSTAIVGAGNCMYCYGLYGEKPPVLIGHGKKHYDEPAERRGYKLGRDGNWHKPLPLKSTDDNL
jgi:hypothetical protein